MNKKRQKQIEDLAKATLQSKGQYDALPVDISSLAKGHHIDVVEYDFGDDVSGVLLSDGASSTIGVNISNGNQRKRFTIAHELGHYILGHQRKGVFVDTADKYFTIVYRDANSSTGEYVQEREANAFAAALLMPREKVMAEVKRICTLDAMRNDKIDVVQELANRFDVSYQAMAFRLTNLDLLW